MNTFLRGLSVFIVFLLISCSSNDDTSDSGVGAVDTSANLLPVGDSANQLLSSNEFRSLSIEIIFVAGFRPQQTSVNNLTEFINNRAFKPDGVDVFFSEIPSPGESSFSIQEIANLESQQRTVYNEGEDIAVSILFVDAPSEGSTSQIATLGAAYRNTSLVIYESSLRDLARQNSQGISLEAIETAVLQHEFGHIFGLVDLGSPPQSDHEDEDNTNHCNVENCLMQAQLEFSTGMMGMLELGIPELDAQCIADLQANGGR